MKVQSTFYIDFISKTVDVLLISSFITKQMPKLLIFDAFTLLICKKNVAIYALLRCKIFSLKIWLCKIFDKFHVCDDGDDDDDDINDSDSPRSDNGAIVKCQASNSIGKSEETRTLNIFCKSVIMR